ncbi:Tectonic-1 [Clydaea vesicula]|uniref:Tectonic-1 n=1 Tax=Clydaea vesicula TaxID=447962 RepID=A0AAD5XYE2_9FUNG|nr:Tectonic-1 [Clydaea vesicula]
MKYIILNLLLATYINSQTFPINWTEVSEIQTSTQIRNYNTNLGSCSCDLTQNHCDINCCCDKDCNPEQIQKLFTNCEKIFETSSSTTKDYCGFLFNRENFIEKKNLGFCLVKNNNPSEGNYFQYSSTDPKLNFIYDQVKFDQEIIYFKNLFRNKLNDFFNFGYISKVVTKSQQDLNYKFGDIIKIKFINFLDTIGWLNFPKGLNDFQCNDNNPAKFLMDESSSCKRFVVEPALSCQQGSSLSFDYYLNGFNVLKTPSDENPTLAVVSDTKLLPINWNNVTNICQNLILNVDYYVFFNITDGSISSVNASFIQGELRLDQSTNVNQKFTITFLEEGSSIPKIVRSGNPGYLVGAPILFGTLVTQKNLTAIEKVHPNSKKTLSLPKEIFNSATSRLECGEPENIDSRTTIGFGEDINSGCSLYYSLNDLKNNCDNIRAKIFSIQMGSLTEITHFGIFGNSSGMDVTSWVNIINNFDKYLNTPTLLNNTNGICPQVLSNLEIQVIHSNFGDELNPQKGILGMKVISNPGNLKISCSNPAECSNLDENKLFSFRIKSSLEFLFADRSNLVKKETKKLNI